MNAEEYVENVRHEVFDELYNYYFESLPTPIKGPEKYWLASKKLYHSLNEEQKEQLKMFTKLVMTDVVSTIFSKLDNVSSYANQEGCFELRLDGKVINGDLQEYFFMNGEE
ncbi:hypothetical protein M3090_11510 [Bacteroides sp. ET71]|uniref:hypothetical protein n=1 Tax=Bacteroides sp. ET71 TaxID=2939421 RepID=UPI002012ACB1|nr:hypothetical protein [Bacteroides sp. ET71]MCL1617013.1 hypothetical protein [Bacteroides sp. ET71]